jgi:hypothetical protein
LQEVKETGVPALVKDNRTKLIYRLVELEQNIRHHWTDILSIGLAILSIVLMLLEFWGIIKL